MDSVGVWPIGVCDDCGRLSFLVDRSRSLLSGESSDQDNPNPACRIRLGFSVAERSMLCRRRFSDFGRRNGGFEDTIADIALSSTWSVRHGHTFKEMLVVFGWWNALDPQDPSSRLGRLH